MEVDMVGDKKNCASILKLLWKAWARWRGRSRGKGRDKV